MRRSFLSVAAAALTATIGFVRDFTGAAALSSDAIDNVNLALGHIPEDALPQLTFSRGGHIIRRSRGSRHHRHFAKARASGRHDFRKTL